MWIGRSRFGTHGLAVVLALGGTSAPAMAGDTVACPPITAAQVLAELTNGTVNRQPSDEYAGSYDVSATFNDREWQMETKVEWTAKPDGTGGSKVYIENSYLNWRKFVPKGMLLGDWVASLPKRQQKQWREQEVAHKENLRTYYTGTVSRLTTTCKAGGGSLASADAASTEVATTGRSAEEACALLGGTLKSDLVRGLSLGRQMEVVSEGYRTTDSLFKWSGVAGISACVRGGKVHGPLVVKAGGRPSAAAFYVDGLLTGTLTTWEGAQIDMICEYDQGIRHGAGRYFRPDSGEPLRFLTYESGRVIGCSGACVEKFSATHYIGPAEYAGHPQHKDFLDRMETAKEREQAEINARAEELERLRREREARDAARLARARASSEDKARSVGFQFVKSDCSHVRLGASSPDSTGWFRVEGDAICNEEFKILGEHKTLPVRKRVSMFVAPAEDQGMWESLFGVNYYDY